MPSSVNVTTALVMQVFRAARRRRLVGRARVLVESKTFSATCLVLEMCLAAVAVARAARSAQRGADLRYDLEITLEEAARWDDGATAHSASRVVRHV